MGKFYWLLTASIFINFSNLAEAAQSKSIAQILSVGCEAAASAQKNELGSITSQRDCLRTGINAINDNFTDFSVLYPACAAAKSYFAIQNYNENKRDSENVFKACIQSGSALSQDTQLKTLVIKLGE